MCGIIGLFLKDATLHSQLGVMSARMLASMAARGPDSAGFAVYGPTRLDDTKLTVRMPAHFDFAAFAARLEAEFPTTLLEARDTHAVILARNEIADEVAAWLLRDTPDIAIVSRGRSMELYKGVGAPDRVIERFGLEAMQGSHLIGHTRMATESAVNVDGAHPYSTGADQCLVHNGSLSNHNAVRRQLMREGLSFQTENDTEVAAGYLTWRMREGMSLGDSMNACLDDLDGFYTFVVGTENGFAVLRDRIACKPALMVETDRYVAFGTEYRALAELPGVEQARVWEPEPATVYFWER